MAFQDRRTGQWAVNPWINGRHVYRTLSRKNLQKVGMDPSLLTKMDKSLANWVGTEYIRLFKDPNTNQANIIKPATLLSAVIETFINTRTATDNTRVKLVLKNFLRLTGDRLIRNITIEELDLFRKSTVDSTSAKSPFTHFDYIKELQSFLKWSFDAQYITNPQLIRHLKLRKPRISTEYLSDDKIKKEEDEHGLFTVVGYFQC